ncbi:MAG TPA: MFS transporter [Methylomirabilota bacterium]|nr:MFS transporter [Methylomirabilota bacterium]
MTGPTLELLTRGPFARIMLTNFFFFAALNGFVLLPLYIQLLGGDEADIGLVQGLYSAAGIVCQPVIGALVDYLGRRFFMRVGAGLLLLSCGLFVVSSPLPLLGALRALQGVAFSAFFVANYIHVVEMVPVERRGWALGIFGVSGLVSTSLAPLFGELIIRRFGFPSFFAVTALIAAGAVALCWRVRDVRPAALGARPGLHVIREGLRELRHMHMLLAFFFGLGTGTIFTFLPTFGEVLGVASVGLFYTAYAVAAMLVRVAGGTLIDVRGRRAVIIPSLFVQTAATCVLALVALLFRPTLGLPVLPFLFLAGFLAGGAHGFLYPAMSALLMDVTPERRRGSAVGLFSSVFLVGNTTGAVVFGYVAHGLGYPPMWSALTGVLLIGFLLSFRLRVGYAARAPLAAIQDARG